MEAGQEEEEPSSVDMKPEVVEREVPVEDTEVMPVGELKKKSRRDQKLATERCRQMKERTQDGCRGRLVVPHRGTSRRVDVAQQKKISRKVPRNATVAWCKRNILRKSMTQGKCGLRHEFAADRNMTSHAGVTGRKGDLVNAEQDTWKGRMTIKNVGSRWPLCRKKKVPTKELIGGCRSGQRIVGSSVSIQQDKDWTLWRGRPPPIRKKKRRKQPI
jgi:hypothetical protein